MQLLKDFSKNIGIVFLTIGNVFVELFKAFCNAIIEIFTKEE